MIARPDFSIISNTKDVQAIRTDSVKAAVFYEPGSVDFGDGWEVSVDRKGIVLLTVRNGRCSITVADPMYNQQKITVSVNRTIKWPSVAVKNGVSYITIDLPQGAMQGSSVKLDCAY
ncbi:polysaccharide lyase beta-sandwich domain-containing protein [Paraflavitalea speifideaquila]|uniref:polysaccharide lyase beta-sandwich domain-containing protein n=1 Tax=Paraflavitalea speifideaquila TaxID=3076558 RepID=UPI0028EFDF3C|nr:polysaccharide lyase beta-sandwich domain-containing protein [Paraflavitalea speifideiaquila]